MLELLRRCIEFDEPDAWGDLFVLVEETASPPIRRVLRRFGISKTETEDVVLELLVELWLDDCRKLRSCRARSDAEFRGWIWHVAGHFARDLAARRLRAARRERVVVSQLGQRERLGDDEHTLRARVDEWRLLMAPPDFDRLLISIGWAMPEEEHCERTQRHWTQQLLASYPHLFGDGG